MSRKMEPFSALLPYLPDNCYEDVVAAIKKHKIEFTITGSRKSKLGDYMAPHAGHSHRITVNGTLNKYAFLITFLHELAHLEAFEDHGMKIQPHGKEWKQVYRRIMLYFLGKNVFPADVAHAIDRSLHNLPASSCSDPHLQRVLKKYDANIQGLVFVENLAPGDLFVISGGRVFQRGEKLKSRYKCLEVRSRKWYLINGLHECKKIEQQP